MKENQGDLAATMVAGAAFARRRRSVGVSTGTRRQGRRVLLALQD